MNQNSSTKNFSLLIWLLIAAVLVKLMWVTVAYLYLPEKGVDMETGRAKSVLHYRYKFASDIALPKVKSPTKNPARRVVSIRDMQLVGIYSSGNSCIVTLLKKGKSFILSNGEKIDGFVLKRATAKEAYFEKAGKEYTLRLFEEKRGDNTSTGIIEPVQQSALPSTREEDAEISSRDGVKLIPRNLLKSYVSDMQKAMQDIGLRPVRKAGQMLGYKVRFIRRSSPLSKLGLRRGDIVKAINGEDIVDLSGPMGILRAVDTIEGATITIIRNNEEKELEYEVK